MSTNVCVISPTAWKHGVLYNTHDRCRPFSNKEPVICSIALILSWEWLTLHDFTGYPFQSLFMPVPAELALIGGCI